MATATQQISEAIAKIREDRAFLSANIKKAKIGDLVAGNENEYRVLGVVGGIESLLTDISALVRNEKLFLSLSSYAERALILTTLTNLSAHTSTFRAQIISIVEQNIAVAVNYQYTHPAAGVNTLPIVEILAALEQLKPLLRTFRTKEAPERFQELSEQVACFIRAKQESEALLVEAQAAFQVIENVGKEVNVITERSNRESGLVTEQLDRAKEITAAIERVEVGAKEISEKIDAALAAAITAANNVGSLFSKAVGESSLIEQFSVRVEKRNAELDRQSSVTDNYQQKLVSFDKNHTELLAKIEETSEKAKTALNLGSEVALGGHFNSQYETARRGQWLWIALSVAAFAAAIYLGHDSVTGSADDPLAYLRRFTLVPLVLLGAYFCGRQYEKQKNITEDYAHKKVLALSLSSFKEQLIKDPESASYLSDYMTKVLTELHRYPYYLQPKIKTPITPNFDGLKKYLEDAADLKDKVLAAVKVKE